MKKFWKKFRRIFRRNPNNFAYALAYHKVANRLGIARSKVRQLRQENEYLSNECLRMRKEQLKNAPSVPIDVDSRELAS